jgi:ligand-binding sensor domain-containing protein
VNALQTGALYGGYVYSAAQLGGLAVYEVSPSGGQQFRSQLGNQNPGGFAVFDQVANATTLFAVGSDAFNGGILILDLQQQPPAPIATVSTGSAGSNAVALDASNLFVGTQQGLLVFDVSQPSQPSQISSLSTPINALRAVGNFLFAGTADGRLVVYNVTSPGSPTLVASVNLPDKAIQISNSGSLLLIADRTGGCWSLMCRSPPIQP